MLKTCNQSEKFGHESIFICAHRAHLPGPTNPGDKCTELYFVATNARPTQASYIKHAATIRQISKHNLHQRLWSLVKVNHVDEDPPIRCSSNIKKTFVMKQISF